MPLPELKKIFSYFFGLLFVLMLFFFVSAGTIYYWQAWLYLLVVFVPAFFVIIYLIKNSPELIVSRMQLKEKEVRQSYLTKVMLLLFILGFIAPGLDFRFNLSQIPFEISILSNLIVLLSYISIFFVFKENKYVSRILEVQKNQKVISTGPYSIVRHPMYLSMFLMYIFTPLALGSYFSIIFFAPIIPVLIHRIYVEEDLLVKDLPGYREYFQKVKYRLIPFVW